MRIKEFAQDRVENLGMNKRLRPYFRNRRGPIRLF